MSGKPKLAVAKRSMADLTTEQLREAILSGAFPPGARLVEAQLAAETGVSPGTVRAALSELRRDGLVTCQRYSAWAVAALDEQALWEIYTMRAALESAAARLLAARIETADRTALRKAQAALERAETSSSADLRLEADLAFHRLIVERCGNALLTESYARIADKIRWIYALSEARAPEQIHLTDWHGPLATAICAGEGERAANLVFDMFESSFESDLRLFLRGISPREEMPA
ncbi:MAG: GntR family transcriptional regulator [Rhodospirillales bacterium]